MCSAVCVRLVFVRLCLVAVVSLGGGNPAVYGMPGGGLCTVWICTGI